MSHKMNIGSFRYGLSYISGCISVATMLLLVSDVVARYVFNSPIPLVYEFSEAVLMVGIVFFGLAGADHVSVRILVDRLHGKPKRALELVALFLSTAFVAVMTWQTGLKSVGSVRMQESAVAIIEFPIYPARLCVVLGCFALLLVLMTSFVKLLRGGGNNG